LSINIQLYEQLSNEQLLAQVWDILCECDEEFVPALSSRENAVQQAFDEKSTGSVKPISYFNGLKTQSFLLVSLGETAELIGFMSFRANYVSEDLIGYSPSHYITTICIKTMYRNLGITRALYAFLEKQMSVDPNCRYLTTRTWSTNASHIHILEDLDFSLVKKLENHRGFNIDTLYYGKAK
jgi:ribosomal protein S18 acetylase RimI-like enzyme